MSIQNGKELTTHIGHNIVCVGYAQHDKDTQARIGKWVNVAIECETCNEVLIDYDTNK